MQMLALFVVLCAGVFGKIVPSDEIHTYIKGRLGVIPITLEDHYIHTDDGYINHAIRLKGKSPGAPAVIMQHGFLASAWTWIVHEDLWSNAAFYVWNLGYDVWLTNTRGNLFSQNATFVTPSQIKKSKKFWNFTFNEMGHHDVPAHVNYVLSTTGKSKLTYIGWSQGTTQMWIAGSVFGASLASKLNGFIALSPVAFMKNCKSTILNVLASLDIGSAIMDLYPYDFLGDAAAMHEFEQVLCKLTLGVVCSVSIDALCGVSPLDDVTNVENIAAHFPGATAVKDMVHYQQFVGNTRFHYFDYGKAGNLVEYNSSSPPDYDLANFQIPTALFIGEVDDLAYPTDVATLQSKIGSHVVWSRTYKQFSHMTWMVGNLQAQYWLEDLQAQLARFNA